MKNLIPIISFAVVLSSSTAFSQLLLTAVFDGPIDDPLHANVPPRGLPRGVELYATADIADLSIFGLGSASENNDPRIGGVQEFTLSGSASAGDFIYVSYHVPEFTTFFGFAPDFTDNFLRSLNGNDAMELFMNGAVIDVFGEPLVDGVGEPWRYTDSWAYRKSGTGPDGTTFKINNWIIPGRNALDDELTNATAQNPIPVGTYSVMAVPEPKTYAFFFTAFAVGLIVWRHRARS
ncbi:MAG: hypothetical protein O3C43_16785 [Verrucomicrobia bacterium]|nr:hypothetical protein [Verrucomicrobiota bacterium]MDA1068145.1 hypothetical protein [Verrucomicrobiota bacterium]